MERNDLTGKPTAADSIALEMLKYAADLAQAISQRLDTLPVDVSADCLADAGTILTIYAEPNAAWSATESARWNTNRR